MHYHCQIPLCGVCGVGYSGAWHVQFTVLSYSVHPIKWMIKRYFKRDIYVRHGSEQFQMQSSFISVLLPNHSFGRSCGVSNIHIIDSRWAKRIGVEIAKRCKSE